MEVTELTKKIHDEYPKVWECLENTYDNIKLSNEYLIDIYFEQTDIQFVYFAENGMYKLDKIPFSMLYGLLEDFFEENGVVILYEYYFDGFSSKETYYKITIIEKETLEYLSCIRSKTKIAKEAKEQAILEACGILEERLI